MFGLYKDREEGYIRTGPANVSSLTTVCPHYKITPNVKTKKETLFPPTTWHPFMSENNRAQWKTTVSDRENDSSLTPSLHLSLSPFLFSSYQLQHILYIKTQLNLNENIDTNTVDNTLTPLFQELMGQPDKSSGNKHSVQKRLYNTEYMNKLF